MAHNTPLILLAGQARSGKDTVGSFLAKTYNAATIGLADPLKRFASAVFEIPNERLWGPSENRDLFDPRFHDPATLRRVNLNYSAISNDWVDEVLPGLSGEDWDQTILSLDTWFNDMLKRALRDKGLSPRIILQTLGTEWGRTINRNIWVEHATRIARQLLVGGHDYNPQEGLTESEKKAPDYVAITDGRFRNEILAVREANGVALRIVRPKLPVNPNLVVIAQPNHKSEAELTDIPDHFFNDIVTNRGSLEDLFRKIAVHMFFTFGDARGMAENPMRPRA